MRTPLLLMLAVACFVRLSAQPFSMTGKVTSADGEPLAFATLSLAGGTRGTISNVNGDFRLIVREQDRKDSLAISYVGYHTRIIQIGTIGSEKLHIQLEEKEHFLQDVVVTSLTANGILENALERIDENYFSEPHISKGFYRMSAKKNGTYVQLSEAAFDLYRSRIPENEYLFRLDTWRGIVNEREVHGLEFALKPGAIFSLDVVNTPDFRKIFGKRRFLKEHQFILEGEFLYSGEPVYLVSFDQRDGVKDVGFKGKFYIHRESFAFLEMDYGFSPKSVGYHKFSVGYRALMELFGIDINVLGDTKRIRYQKIGDRYYLKDASGNTDMRFRSNRSHYNFIQNARVDYLVSEILLENPEKFDSEDVLANGKFIEFQEVEYDSLFWKDHTIVLPDTDFGEISSAIEESNEANDTKKEVMKKLRKFPKDPEARIDSILTFYHKKGLFHGNALIAAKGKTVFKKSYPYLTQQLDSASRFRIGSTSKTFTSMLILMLQKEGRLQLSDPVSRYLPDYVHGEVTVEQLLTHQSGIPNYLSTSENLIDVFREEYDPDELIVRFCSDTLEFEPGQEFAYSNSGYVLLARIAEVAGGKSFGELLTQKIFEPLGMKETGFGNSGNTTSTIEGFYYGEPEVSYPVSNVIGAGGIISTTGDLLKWSEALEKRELMDEALVVSAQTPRAEYKSWEADYGYGWMIDRYLFRTSKKHRIIYHPGTDLAFYSMFLTQPDKSITIVLLSNTGPFPRFEMADLILEVLN